MVDDQIEFNKLDHRNIARTFLKGQFHQKGSRYRFISLLQKAWSSNLRDTSKVITIIMTSNVPYLTLHAYIIMYMYKMDEY